MSETDLKVLKEKREQLELELNPLFAKRKKIREKLRPLREQERQLSKDIGHLQKKIKDIRRQEFQLKWNICKKKDSLRTLREFIKTTKSGKFEDFLFGSRQGKQVIVESIGFRKNTGRPYNWNTAKSFDDVDKLLADGWTLQRVNGKFAKSQYSFYKGLDEILVVE